MSIISSGVMGLDGLAYCGLGVCMLSPSVSHNNNDGVPAMAALYPSLFKRFLLLPAQQQASSVASGVDDVDDENRCQHLGGIGEDMQDPVRLARDDLAFRLLGYLVFLLGLCRIVTSFYWGCGYIYLGLGTCLVEIGIVCNELLRHESMLLNRAMTVLLENLVLSLVYMSTAVPHCS